MAPKSKRPVLPNSCKRLAFLCILLFVSSGAISQTPEPKPKPTYLDLEMASGSFGADFLNQYNEGESAEFATWIGVPQKEIRKRRIKKITFKGEGNSSFRPKEAGDYGSHNRAFFGRDQEEARIDTLPPEPDKHYSFNYEFDRDGKIIAADLPGRYTQSIHLRYRYYPDGKLKENRYVSYSPDNYRRDTILRYSAGTVYKYDEAGRIQEKIGYSQRVQSRYQSSYDNSNNKSGYVFETLKNLSKTKFTYNAAGQLMEVRTYQLPDSGQIGTKALTGAEFYFYDKFGNLHRKLAITRIKRPVPDYPADGSMEEVLYFYEGKRLKRQITNEFSFSSAVPDTILAAKGEIGVDSSSLGSQYYQLVGSNNNPGPHPYIKPFGQSDTIFYLQSNETRSNYRNHYLRLNKNGQMDLAFFGDGAIKRYYSKRLLEERTDNGLEGYECRFIWLNRRKQPEREIWLERYNSGRERRYHFCGNYPNEDCHSIEELTMFKRITVVDQKIFYRKDGLPEKVALRASFNKEALRKVGEKNPRPEWAELLLVPCRPCEPCEKVKQFIKENPEWPYRSSAAKEFTDFKYEFY